MFQKKQKGVEFGLLRNNSTHRGPQILHSHKHTAEIFFASPRTASAPPADHWREQAWACVGVCAGGVGRKDGGKEGGGGTVAAGEMV